MTIHNKCLNVIYKITFNTVKYLEVIFIACAVLTLQIMLGLSKSLNYSVISNSNCRMSPVKSTLNSTLYRRYSIHFTETCMKVKLHSLLRSIVYSGDSVIRYGLNSIYLIDKKFFCIGILSWNTFYHYELTSFQFISYWIKVIILYEKLNANSI